MDKVSIPQCVSTTDDIKRSSTDHDTYRIPRRRNTTNKSLFANSLPNGVPEYSNRADMHLYGNGNECDNLVIGPDCYFSADHPETLRLVGAIRRKDLLSIRQFGLLDNDVHRGIYYQMYDNVKTLAQRRHDSAYNKWSYFLLTAPAVAVFLGASDVSKIMFDMASFNTSSYVFDVNAKQFVVGKHLRDNTRADIRELSIFVLGVLIECYSAIPVLLERGFDVFANAPFSYRCRYSPTVVIRESGFDTVLKLFETRPCTNIYSITKNSILYISNRTSMYKRTRKEAGSYDQQKATQMGHLLWVSLPQKMLMLMRKNQSKMENYLGLLNAFELFVDALFFCDGYAARSIDHVQLEIEYELIFGRTFETYRAKFCTRTNTEPNVREPSSLEVPIVTKRCKKHVPMNSSATKSTDTPQYATKPLQREKLRKLSKEDTLKHVFWLDEDTCIALLLSLLEESLNIMLDENKRAPRSPSGGRARYSEEICKKIEYILYKVLFQTRWMSTFMENKDDDKEFVIFFSYILNKEPPLDVEVFKYLRNKMPLYLRLFQCGQLIIAPGCYHEILNWKPAHFSPDLRRLRDSQSQMFEWDSLSRYDSGPTKPSSKTGTRGLNHPVPPPRPSIKSRNLTDIDTLGTPSTAAPRSPKTRGGGTRQVGNFNSMNHFHMDNTPNCRAQSKKYESQMAHDGNHIRESIQLLKVKTSLRGQRKNLKCEKLRRSVDGLTGPNASSVVKTQTDLRNQTIKKRRSKIKSHEVQANNHISCVRYRNKYITRRRRTSVRPPKISDYAVVKGVPNYTSRRRRSNSTVVKLRRENAHLLQQLRTLRKVVKRIAT